MLVLVLVLLVLLVLMVLLLLLVLLTCASCIAVCSIPLSCSSSSSLLCRCHACRMAADSAAMCVASCVRLHTDYYCGSYQPVIM